MEKNIQKLQAECVVEFQVFNPKTQELVWKPYETMTITTSTMEQLIERAHMYLGRPERYDDVQAIRLKGEAVYMSKQKNIIGEHEDTISFSVNILRERTVPLHIPEPVIY